MNRTRDRWLTVAVVLAAVLPYLRVIPDYFIQDDFGTVMILTERPWTTFPRWFTMPWMENIWGYLPDEIRPFVAFSYQLTGKWAPHRPELHHIANIGFHAGNALLVAAIGRAAAGLTPIAAAFAGIVFALLPAQVESAAWITGRVDSMPAFFYLAAFLAYVKWREEGRRSWYVGALVLFFVTLFSKQNAITVPATLAAYDLIVLDRSRRGTLIAAAKAWLPFVIMTVGYLALRRLVIGHTVRGGVQTWLQVETFFGIVWRHLQRVTLGHLAPLSDLEIAGAIVLILLCGAALWLRPERWRAFLCFCIVWWAVGSLPVLVAGYESPRHVYLASAAWAFLLALVLDAVSSAERLRPGGLLSWRRVQQVTETLALVVIALYAVRLQMVVQEWHSDARISKAAVERLYDEAVRAKPGTLLLVSVPRRSWEWGVPFVLRPPYQPEDLSSRVRLVTPWRLYCCGPVQWDEYARSQLRAWSAAPDKPPIIAMRFAERTGEFSRATDDENPELRDLVPVLLQTDTHETLDRAILDLLQRVN